MSLITQAIIAEKYGIRLSMDKLAEALGIARGTIFNQITKGTFPVVTYTDHSGSRWCDYRSLAKYLDECHERAKTPA